MVESLLVDRLNNIITRIDETKDIGADIIVAITNVLVFPAILDLCYQINVLQACSSWKLNVNRVTNKKVV